MSDSVCPKCGLPRVSPQSGAVCACVAVGERSFESDRLPAASSIVSREIHLDREHVPGRPPRRDGDRAPLPSREGPRGLAHAAESPIQSATPAWARDASPLKKVAGAAEPAWFLSPVQSDPPQVAGGGDVAAPPTSPEDRAGVTDGQPVAENSEPPLLSSASPRATRVFGLPCGGEGLPAEMTSPETPTPPSPLLSSASPRATRVFGLPCGGEGLPAEMTSPETPTPPSPLLSSASPRATRVFGLPCGEEGLPAEMTSPETPTPPSPLLSSASPRATRVFGLPGGEEGRPTAETNPETSPEAEHRTPAPAPEAPSASPLPTRPAAAQASPSRLSKPRPAPVAPNAVEEIHAVPAGACGRALARAIDLACLFCLWALLLFLAQSVSGVELLAVSSLQRFAPWLGGLFCALTFAYAALFHALGGRSPGKWVVGIIVLDETGQPPSLGRAALRAVLAFVSAAPLFLGFAVAHFSRRRQAFHDKVARTYVVRLIEPRATRSRAARADS